MWPRLTETTRRQVDVDRTLLNSHSATAGSLLGSRKMTSDPRTRRDVIIDIGLLAFTAACVAATFWFSFVTQPPGVALFAGADEVGHVIAYVATH